MSLTNDEILLGYVIQMKIETHGVCLRIYLGWQPLILLKLHSTGLQKLKTKHSILNQCGIVLTRVCSCFHFSSSVFNGLQKL